MFKRLLHKFYSRLPEGLRHRVRPYIYNVVVKQRFYLKIGKFVWKSMGMTQGMSSKLGLLRCTIDWMRLRSGVRVTPKNVTFNAEKLRFTLDTSRHEIFPFWEIWCDDDYQQLPQFRAAEDSVVVDVGGNIGLYTLRQATRAVRGRIVVFEPGPDTFRRLKTNIEANGLSNVTLVNAAVGASEGTVSFFLHAFSTRAYVTDKQMDGTVEVPCTTLDAALPKHNVGHIDIMKIDTQGHERAVLAGARSILPKTKCLVVEVHGDHEGEKRFIADYLRPFGFRVVESEGSLLYLERDR